MIMDIFQFLTVLTVEKFNNATMQILILQLIPDQQVLCSYGLMNRLIQCTCTYILFRINILKR